jgi:alkylhydroperoxidase family enzyme
VTPEFATLWPTYVLDAKTRALLAYAQKLTETPSQLSESDFEALRTVGWNEQAIFEATALIALFNMSGRLEAASGLPLDQVPATARWLSSLEQEKRGDDCETKKPRNS